MKYVLYVLLLLSAIPSVHSQIPSYIPTNGLVGWWPFNGNANDESGNGNNGTVYGAILSSDRYGTSNNAFSFNGTNSYIQMINPGPLGNTSRSVSVWVKTTETRSERMIVSWGANGPVGADFNLWSNYSCNGFSFDINSSARTFNSQFNNGQWNHYVVVYDNSLGSTISIVKVYQNSILLSSVCASVGTGVINTLGTFPITVGRYHGNNEDHLNGNIDDIGIWNRALTSQEVSVMYANSMCGVTILPVITGGTQVYTDTTYTYSITQVAGRSYQWTTRNGGIIQGSSTNSSVQITWDTIQRDTIAVRETDNQTGCYKDTMLIVQSRFPLYYSAQWVNTAPRIIPNPTNGMSCYPGTPNCVGGSIDSTTIPGSRMVTYGVFNAKPDTIMGINPVLPTVRFQIVYRDNGDIIHDSGPLGSDRVSYTSSIGLVKCRLGPFTYDYGRELSLKVISPSGTQTTDIVSLLKANGDLYIKPE